VNGMNVMKRGRHVRSKAGLGRDARGIGGRGGENVYYSLRIQIATITLY